jgi:hypothetical protein
MPNDRASELDVKRELFRECAEKAEALARAFRAADAAFPQLSRDAARLVERQLYDLTRRACDVIGTAGAGDSVIDDVEENTPVVATERLFHSGDLTNGAVICASAFIGTKETSPNSGPVIDEMLAGVGLPPGNPWCAAFVHHCFHAAANALEMLNPCPKTGGVLKMWDQAPDAAKVDKPVRGAIIVMDHGKGHGHCGIVEAVNGGGLLESIEGNSDRGGSRTGGSVVRHVWRPEDGARGRLVGYIDLALVPLVSKKTGAA